MITDIFKKNYLLELNTDLQKYIKSFLSYDEIILIYLNQYIPNLKKKNKRFYNKVEKQCKYYTKYDLIDEINTFFDIHWFYEVSCFKRKDIENRYYEYKNILKYLESSIIVIYLEKSYKRPIIMENSRWAVYTKMVSDMDDILDLVQDLYFTNYKKKQINKLIDIFNNEDPNIFI